MDIFGIKKMTNQILAANGVAPASEVPPARSACLCCPVRPTSAPPASPPPAPRLPAYPLPAMIDWQQRVYARAVAGGGTYVNRI